MNLRNLYIPAVIVLLVALAWRAMGWPGIALVASGLVLWALLHFNQLMRVMKRAADNPIGYVGSAVMLNARLKAGVNLMHVVAITRALGEQLSAPNAQPEVFRWTDGTQSHVTCEFAQGRLVRWQLERPDGGEQQDGVPAES